MQAFLEFLATLTDCGNRSQRQAFSRLLPSVRDVYYRGFAEILEKVGQDRRTLEADLAVITCMGLLWHLVPDSLFTRRDVDYEELARDAWLRVVESEPTDSIVDGVSVVFRRLRQYYIGDFRRSSLDMDLIAHQKLMRDQKQRCAVCNYFFEIVDPKILNDDSIELTEPYETVAGEVALRTYFRRPELDHIVPYFLGGDGPENWQILCKSCNAGKGAALAWLSRKGWMPPNNPQDARVLSPSLRYVCIARHAPDFTSLAARDITVRVFKRDERGLVTLPNLEVRMC
jgi:5-methylcytosine-specific restriction endonuclease McrA